MTTARLGLKVRVNTLRQGQGSEIGLAFRVEYWIDGHMALTTYVFIVKLSAVRAQRGAASGSGAVQHEWA